MWLIKLFKAYRSDRTREKCWAKKTCSGWNDRPRNSFVNRLLLSTVLDDYFSRYDKERVERFLGDIQAYVIRTEVIYFLGLPNSSTAFFALLMIALRKVGILAFNFSAFSSMLPNSVMIYQTKTIGQSKVSY